jgi:predicted ATPase
MRVICPNCQYPIERVEVSSPEAIRCPECGSIFRPEPDKTWIASDSERQTIPVEVGKTISHYRLGERVGSGGMGVVFKAQDTRLGRSVALKFLPQEYARDPQRLERFQREARATSALNHPHICTIYDMDEHEGQPFLVMELIEGQTLQALAARRLPLPEIVPVVSQVAKALAAAHAAGLAHRDIKPENIMVRDDGYAKVLDFGLARLLPSWVIPADEAATEVTDPGTLLGTVRYMSPEQARAEIAGSASDLFSLGVVLYELATGQHPFQADSEIGILHAILVQPPLRPSLVNPEIAAPLEALILRMLEKDARLRPTAAEVDAELKELSGKSTGVQSGPASTSIQRHTVGRLQELTELRAGFESADAGRGQFLCVTGEPGIGKTTLVEDFLADLAASGHTCTVGRGRCSERLAGAEAYLPFLEALESLLHGTGGDAVARVMKAVAPTWYAQIVPLAAEDPTFARVLQQAKAASQERLKRELAAFLAEMSRLRPLLLFLDDLHWADASTVDLLAYVGGRCAESRLLLVLTYRPTDLLLRKHPFIPVKQDLQAHGLCREVVLQLLSRPDIERYLALEYPEHRFPDGLATLIHDKTEGNPLFVVDLLRHLRDQKVLAREQDRWVLAQSLPNLERDLPASVRSMIERKIDQLSEEDWRLLMAASVQGYEFDASVMAKALGLDATDVEERLEALERVHSFVRLVREHEFPDGTLTVHYRFVHVLYQNALFAPLRPTRRAALSGAVAQALQDCYGEKSAAVAGELALLWEAARNFSRAAEFFLLAAQTAARLFANHEAVVLARRGLELLQKLPDAPERAAQELALQITLGPALIATKDWMAPEVERTYTRAQALCRQVGETPQLFPVLWGLWFYHVLRAEIDTGRNLGRQLLSLAQRAQDPALLLQALHAVGPTYMLAGDAIAGQAYLEQGIALYNPEQHRTQAFVYGGHDPGVCCQCHAAWNLWLLGYPAQALERGREALALARELSHPTTLAHAQLFISMMHQFRREAPESRELTEALVGLAAGQGLPTYEAVGLTVQGWALAEEGHTEEGIAQIRQGLAAWDRSPRFFWRINCLPLLATAYGKGGRAQEGLAVLTEVLSVVAECGFRFYEPEMLRLQGELLLAQAPGQRPAAESCFRKAIASARRQSSKSWELRAVTSLSRLYSQVGKNEEARQMLTEIYGWFTEGFDTVDLREAKALLQEVS